MMDDFNMDDVQREVTDAVIYEINHQPALLKRLGLLVQGDYKAVMRECVQWAEEHDGVLGEHFVGELEMADWEEVRNAISTR